MPRGILFPLERGFVNAVEKRGVAGAFLGPVRLPAHPRRAILAEVTFSGRNMTYVVDLATAVRHRLVFELRYEGGELDRTRAVASLTVANREGWATNVIDTNGCHIRNDDDNLVFSFSPTSASLSQSQSCDVGCRSDLQTGSAVLA